ncbi:hypothetical protein [Streptomyces sp. NPDC085540]|uniref:hypothetical protein n=1 Tax=Streptomyces sp. NPDC085540 TaxID=3365730 RepID=UPI0037D5716F
MTTFPRVTAEPGWSAVRYRTAADGQHGPIWWRYGRERGGQTLTAARDNHGPYSRDAHLAREAARRAAVHEQAAAHKAAAEPEREASR